jgi:hypothetical protein
MSSADTEFFCERIRSIETQMATIKKTGNAVHSYYFSLFCMITRGKARLREPVLRLPSSFCQLDHLLSEELLEKFPIFKLK